MNIARKTERADVCNFLGANLRQGRKARWKFGQMSATFWELISMVSHKCAIFAMLITIKITYEEVLS